MSSMSSGILTFDDTGESIGPATTAAVAQELRIFSRGRLHLGGGKARLAIDRCLITGRAFNATLHFDGPRLEQIDLVMPLPTDGKGWENWTQENEMARKSAHETWAAQTFGRPLTIMPYLTPEPIYPAEPGPDHPRHALFDWGEVTSYFDSRGGSAWLRIKYA